MATEIVSVQWKQTFCSNLIQKSCPTSVWCS